MIGRERASLPKNQRVMLNVIAKVDGLVYAWGDWVVNEIEPNVFTAQAYHNDKLQGSWRVEMWTDEHRVLNLLKPSEGWQTAWKAIPETKPKPRGKYGF